MKKLIIQIGNETHELPYNGGVFSFEVEEKYVPKVGDVVWTANGLLEPYSFTYNNLCPYYLRLAEKGLLFPSEAEFQKFADHCLKYFDKK